MQRTSAWPGLDVKPINQYLFGRAVSLGGIAEITSDSNSLATNALDYLPAPPRPKINAIDWDGDTYELPPEMMWDLPSTYLMPDYSKVLMPAYETKVPRVDVLQDDINGVFGRMENGHLSSQGSWVSEKPEVEEGTVVHNTSFTQSLVLSPLLTHHSTLRDSATAQGMGERAIDAVERLKQADDTATATDLAIGPPTPQSPPADTFQPTDYTADEAEEPICAHVESSEPDIAIPASSAPDRKLVPTGSDHNEKLLDHIPHLDLDASTSPIDDPSLSGDSSPAGQVTTPPDLMVGDHINLDEAINSHYNGDPTVFDDLPSVIKDGSPHKGGRAVKDARVGPALRSPLYILCSPFTAIDGDSADGDYETIDEESTSMRLVPALHPRSLAGGPPETSDMSSHDKQSSAAVCNSASLQDQRDDAPPATDTDGPEVLPSSVRPSVLQSNAINITGYPSSSPAPQQSSPTPAPGTPSKRQRNKFLRNTTAHHMRIENPQQELVDHPRFSNAASPASIVRTDDPMEAILPSGTEHSADPITPTKTPALVNDWRDSFGLNLLASAARRRSNGKEVKLDGLPKEPNTPVNDETQHVTTGQQGEAEDMKLTRSETVGQDQPAMGLLDATTHVFVSDVSKDDKTGILYALLLKNRPASPIDSTNSHGEGTRSQTTNDVRGRLGKKKARMIPNDWDEEEADGKAIAIIGKRSRVARPVASAKPDRIPVVELEIRHARDSSITSGVIENESDGKETAVACQNTPNVSTPELGDLTKKSKKRKSSFAHPKPTRTLVLDESSIEGLKPGLVTPDSKLRHASSRSATLSRSSLDLPAQMHTRGEDQLKPFSDPTLVQPLEEKRRTVLGQKATPTKGNHNFVHPTPVRKVADRTESNEKPSPKPPVSLTNRGKKRKLEDIDGRRVTPVKEIDEDTQTELDRIKRTIESFDSSARQDIQDKRIENVSVAITPASPTRTSSPDPLALMDDEDGLRASSKLKNKEKRDKVDEEEEEEEEDQGDNESRAKVPESLHHSAYSAEEDRVLLAAWGRFGAGKSRADRCLEAMNAAGYIGRTAGAYKFRCSPKGPLGPAIAAQLKSTK